MAPRLRQFQARHPSDILRANSFADLLQPIPNAARLLKAVDESAPVSSADENVQLVQYHHHHHHHHHHGFRRYGPRLIVVPHRITIITITIITIITIITTLLTAAIERNRVQSDDEKRDLRAPFFSPL